MSDYVFKRCNRVIVPKNKQRRLNVFAVVVVDGVEIFLVNSSCVVIDGVSKNVSSLSKKFLIVIVGALTSVFIDKHNV